MCGKLFAGTIDIEEGEWLDWEFGGSSLYHSFYAWHSWIWVAADLIRRPLIQKSVIILLRARGKPTKCRVDTGHTEWHHR